MLEVLQPAVAGQKRDGGAGFPFRQQLPGRGQMGSGREAGEDPLLGRQMAGRGDGLLVADRDVAGRERPVEQRIQVAPGVAGALDACRGLLTGPPASTAAPAGSTTYVRTAGIEPSGGPGDAGERTAGPDHVEEDVDLALRIAPRAPARCAARGPARWPARRNWSTRNASRSATIRRRHSSTSARSSPETWPSTAPSAWSTTITSAPNASIWRTRSTELPREITATNGCPIARQTIARPVPVLPLVSSTTVWPGRSSPARRASRMISRAIRSFLLPPGLNTRAWPATGRDRPRDATLRDQFDQRRVADHVEDRASQRRMDCVLIVGITSSGQLRRVATPRRHELPGRGIIRQNLTVSIR